MNITSVLQDPPLKCSPYEVGVGCKERVRSAQLVNRDVRELSCHLHLSGLTSISR
jgi:hypothetical protein